MAQWNNDKLYPLKIGVHKHFDKRIQSLLKSYEQEHLSHSKKCDFCGGTYKRLAHCVFHNNMFPIKSNIVCCCSLCYMITNFSPFFKQHIILRSSNMSQLQIIRATVDYIIKNKKIPTPEQIDPLSNDTNIVINRYFALGHIYSDIAKQNKVFIRDSFNVSYICAVEIDYFADDPNEHNERKKNISIIDYDNTLQKYQNHSKYDSIFHITKRYRKYIEVEQKANEMIDTEYNIIKKNIIAMLSK